MSAIVGFYIKLAKLYGENLKSSFTEMDLLISLFTDVIYNLSGLASVSYTKHEENNMLGLALSSHTAPLFLNSGFFTIPVDVQFDSSEVGAMTLNITVWPDRNSLSKDGEAVSRKIINSVVGDWLVKINCFETEEALFENIAQNVAMDWPDFLSSYNHAMQNVVETNPHAEAVLQHSLSNQLKLNEVLTYSNHLANEFNNKNIYIQDLLSENARLMDQRSAANRLLDYAARKLNSFGRKAPLGISQVGVQSAAKAADAVDVKKRHTDRAKERLNAFLDSGKRLVIGDPDRPIDVSIIMVTWGRSELTFECLESLVSTKEPNIEVVVLDNNSPDNTLELLKRFDGNITVIENENNDGFLLATNMAAKHAQSDVLLLLNNDTTLPSFSIGNALKRLKSSSEIGAVAAKIILPDGLLQEAGSLVWNNGGALGYLRGVDPDDPRCDFARPVDFGSGAFLMVDRVDWEEIGGFDEQFVPAYYEEVDFCLCLRRIGKHVVYDPSVVLHHFEFGSSKKKDDAIALQKTNRLKFESKHKEFLQSHRFLANEKNILKSRSTHLDQRNGLDVIKKNVLFIDDIFPDPALGSGFGRACDMVDILSKHVHQLSFLPLNFPDEKPDHWRSFWDNRVEVLYGVGRKGFEAYIREWVDYFDHIFVSRPHNIEFIRSALPSDLEAKVSAKLVYDAEAIFTLREKMKAELDGVPWSENTLSNKLSRELALAQGLSHITVVSKHDASYFRAEHPNANIRVLMHACSNRKTSTKYSKRKDVLFVGSLAEPTSPNVDGVKNLCKLWANSPLTKNINLNIVGGLGNSGWHIKYANSNIHFKGRVENLTPLYESHRVFVAPVRFAAGVPIKVLEAMSYGIPCVVSTILGEQLSIELSLIHI